MKKSHLILGLLGLAAVAVVPGFLKNYGIHIFTTWMVYIIATMGLNLTVGYAGQKSLGHAAFFGIGAYAAVLGTGDAGPAPLWLLLPLSIGGAALYALFVGALSLRTFVPAATLFTVR